MLADSRSLEFRIFDTDASLLPVVPAWEELAQRCEAGFSFFAKPQWVLSWMNGYPDNRLKLITAWRGGSMVLMTAMADCTIAGMVRQWCTATFPEAGYSGTLIADEENSAELMSEMLKFVRATGEADMLVFPSVPENTQWLPEDTKMVTQSAASYAAMIDTVAENRVAKSKSSIKKLRRKYRKLEELGEITLEKIDHDHPLAPGIIDTMIDWKIKWLDERGLMGQAVRSENFRRFLNSLMQKPDYQTPGCFCMALCCDGKPVTSYLFLPDADILHCYFTAFDPDISELSPGQVLIEQILQWMEDTPWRYYDFEGFPEPYKDKLATDQTYLFDIAYPISAKGKLVAPLRRIRPRMWAKRAFYKLPKGLRAKLIPGA
jgi:CelD/BcsL family acetyltransferase involved in cellulose biosynthesis